MSDLSPCGRCGRQVAPSALKKVGSGRYCSACIENAIADEANLLAEARRLAQEAQAAEKKPRQTQESQAAEKKAGEGLGGKIMQAIRTPANETPDTWPCYKCHAQFPVEKVFAHEEHLLCTQCLTQERQAETARRQAMAGGDLNPVLEQLKETHRSVRTIRGIMIFFCVLAVLALINSCAQSCHSGAFR